MKGKLINKWTWLWVLVLLAFIVTSYISYLNQPQEYPAYVSHSPSPSGTKAIYTYFANEYGAVNRWSNEPALLRGENQRLLMIEPFFIPNQNEMSYYKEYMHAGNSLLLFSDNPVGMFDIKVDYLGAPSEEGVPLEDMEGTDYEGVLFSQVRIQTEENDEILLEDAFGPIAVKRPYGEGELIISNTPEWFMNDLILDYDHLSLILELLNSSGASGELVFDEYIHGATPSVTTLYPKAFLVFLLQGAVITLFWLWYRGKRFGPILQPREESVRFSDERVQALAAWYLRLKDKGLADSLKIQADYLKVLLQEKWGIPYMTEWADTKNQLERKWITMPKSEIETFLTGLHQVLKKDKISKQEYLLWSKKLEQLRKGVEEG